MVLIWRHSARSARCFVPTCELRVCRHLLEHHHLTYSARRVNGSVLWANLHVFFWLSLLPFTTNWMGENHLASWPTALYGFDLFMTAVAWYILTRALIGLQRGANSMLERAIGADRKGKISVVLYLVAIVASFWEPWVAAALYARAVVWLVPDWRVEKVLLTEEQ